MREPEQGYVIFPQKEDEKPITFPRLKVIQNWAMHFGRQVPVGMTGDCGNCPLSNALTFLLGGRFIVDEQEIVRLERGGSVIAKYIPPRLYSQFVQRVDALAPEKTERATRAENASRLR